MAPAHAEVIDNIGAPEIERIPDATAFATPHSMGAKVAALGISLAAGAGAASILKLNLTTPSTFEAFMIPLALAGGLLSTWSPCGYSSVCLLRPNGRWSPRSVAAWSPTLLSHAVGYLLGALVLGGVLGGAGALLGLGAVYAYALPIFALLFVAYGVHQFGFLPMPYPQRRSQVPHDARQRFPKWVIGLLYGFSLGLNYCTYVQTPLLYAVTGAALLSASPATAITLFVAFNAARFAPVLLNALPISDARITAWLARHQENAALIDGMLLCAAGAFIAASLAA